VRNLAELLKKEKNLHWRNILGFQQWNFYSDIMFCCRDFWYWKVSFSGKIGQNWAVFCL